jgi:hypothetical protein
MLAQLIIDNRTDPSQLIRSPIERRKKTVRSISNTNPILDCNGELIIEDRRYFFERRSHSVSLDLVGT